MMANVRWVKLGTRSCSFLDGKEVDLLEKRVYPTGIQAGAGSTYRVEVRKCSAGYQCGHMEDPCAWAEVGHDGRLYHE